MASRDGEGSASVHQSVIDPDARKLLWVLASFNWTALLLLSRTAPLDFVAFFTAGHLVASGDGQHLFDLATQTQFQNRVIGQAGCLPFYHLAYESLAFVPLSVLSLAWSLWVWRAVLLGMIVGICIMLRRISQLTTGDSFLLIVSFLSTAESVAQGQDSLLLLMILSATFWSLLNKNDATAGGLLALSIFKPQIVLPIAFVLVWKRGWRFTATFIAGVVLALTLSTLITGAEGWVQWLDLIRKAASGGGVEIGATPNSMANLRGLAQLVTHSLPAEHVITVLVTLGVLGITAWCIRKSLDARQYLPPTIAMSVLVSFHSNIHDLAILLIPIFALIAFKNLSVGGKVCIGLCFAFPFFLAAGGVRYFGLVAIALWFFTIQLPQPEAHFPDSMTVHTA